MRTCAGIYDILCWACIKYEPSNLPLSSFLPFCFSLALHISFLTVFHHSLHFLLLFFLATGEGSNAVFHSPDALSFNEVHKNNKYGNLVMSAIHIYNCYICLLYMPSLYVCYISISLPIYLYVSPCLQTQQNALSLISFVPRSRFYVLLYPVVIIQWSGVCVVYICIYIPEQ